MGIEDRLRALARLIWDERKFEDHMAALRRIEEGDVKIGTGVEWTGADGAERFGVVMTSPRIDMGVPIVDCTVDTFRGDSRCLVPVEVSRLRLRPRAYTYAEGAREGS